jgi:phosphatidylglycerophosphate synthase
MWLAHALTLSRIPIAIAFWWAYDHTSVALALIALAALTDTLDGNVARYMKWRGAGGPDIGGWLDPLVDKLFVAIVLGVIWFHAHDLLVIVLVGARELVLVPLIAIYLAARIEHGELRADPFGKVATVVQFFALAVVLALPEYALVAATVAAVFGLVAAAHYIARAGAETVRRMHNVTRPSGPRDTSTTASSAR